MKSTIAFFKRHDGLTSFIIGVLLIATLYSIGYGIYRHKYNQARSQAIARAKQMDGQTYTIDNVAWNWIGDTQLFLKDEHGKDAGWIMIYMANPFDKKINPLSLAFSNPHGRIPVPMKIRTHFRETPWTDKYDGRTKDTFTGSFIDFEIL